MKLSLETEGIDKLNKKLKGYKTVAGRVVTRAAALFEREAKKNIQKSVYASPMGKYKRTGKARQSIIRSPLGNNTERVYMGVNYGRYLEYGTGVYVGHTSWFTRLSNLTGQASDSKRLIKLKGMRPRPFWRPAIDTTKSQIQNIIKSELNS